MTIQEAKRHISTSLSAVMDASEADATAKLILEEVKGYTAVELLMHAQRTLLPETEERIESIIRRIKGGMPAQYALGTAWFHGRKFSVNPSVLIPRPETSQLIDIISDRWGKTSDLSVLDIGTGSGCIAISLALDLPFAQVKAVDISADALDTAKDNAKNLHAKVDFIKADAFDLQSCPDVEKSEFDIIVSNPPYVLESERDDIDPRVKDHEPAMALFVPDDKKTAIYSAIIGFAFSHLNDRGMLYLEINPLCDSEILAMLEKAGFSHSEIVADYKGAKRFAIANK